MKVALILAFKEFYADFMKLYENDRYISDPQEAAEFVKKTGVTCLAVLIGNAHIGFQKIYGYIVNEDKKLIIDKEPAGIVKKIYENDRKQRWES